MHNITWPQLQRAEGTTHAVNMRPFNERAWLHTESMYNATPGKVALAKFTESLSPTAPTTKVGRRTTAFLPARHVTLASAQICSEEVVMCADVAMAFGFRRITSHGPWPTCRRGWSMHQNQRRLITVSCPWDLQTDLDLRQSTLPNSEEQEQLLQT